MFCIPGILALITLVYLRPQEFIEPLQAVPLLYIAFALAVFGFVVDVRLRKSELFSTPLLWLSVAFFGWLVLTALAYEPREAPLHAIDLAIPLVLFLLVGYGVQGYRALHAVGGVTLAMVLFVTAVGVHQWFQPTGCIEVNETVASDTFSGTFDGRWCDTAHACYLGTPEPGAQYRCEKIGLFGTNSVGEGRVRWRGVLQDPNELALAGGIGIPLAFGLGLRRRALPRWLLNALTLAVVMVCAMFTGSRGGQLVVLAVLGAYFVKRYGYKGLSVGALLALPVLVLGGRAGDSAEQSTNERIECWYEALQMFQMNPLLGVGYSNFGEYHYLTAHNSFMLALGETGFPGLLLFSLVVYLAVKIPCVILKRYSDPVVLTDPVLAAGAPMARGWSMALLATYCGLAVGIFFLSFTYHPILWIYIGLSAALYGATRAHDPALAVGFGWRDVLTVAAACVVLVAGVYVLTRAMT